MKEFRILAPTGVLGAGFTPESLATGVALSPHVIACDAGSTDSGPAALGSGIPKLSDATVERDLRLLLRARAELGVPLIIGSCGTSGRDSGVDHLAELARSIAEEEQMSFTLALVYSEQSTDTLSELWDTGAIHPLDPPVPLDRDKLLSSTVVAMMGSEPIENALSRGADVVLAGRASDTALFAALPHMHGADAGLTWHAAKTIECGAACAVPPSADGLFVWLRDDHFDVRALQPGTRLTAQSVAAHTLYENIDPFKLKEPGGVLDTSTATYEQLDDTTVRVRGSKFEAADIYTNKLEGARARGFQTFAVGGIRDRAVIARIAQLIPMAQEHFTGKIESMFDSAVSPDDVDIDFTLYGANGVLGEREPEHTPSRELGILITVTAHTQEIAHSVCASVAHVVSHLPIPEYDGLASTVAYPFSPPETDRGPVYEFTINHVAAVAGPLDLFRTKIVVVGV